MADLRELAHDLSNGLAATRLWLLHLQTASASCPGCSARQLEPLETLTRLVDQMEKTCDQLREMAQPKP
jgi:hypothetical protein